MAQLFLNMIICNKNDWVRKARQVRYNLQLTPSVREKLGPSSVTSPSEESCPVPLMKERGCSALYCTAEDL
jgi:hypothetical protein